MVEIIDAELSPIVEPSFPTIKEAIAFGNSIDAERTNDDILRCKGQLITSAHWCRERLVLILGNHKRLCFVATLATVEVTVEDDSTSIVDDMKNAVSDQKQTDDTLVIRVADQEIHWQ